MPDRNANGIDDRWEPYWIDDLHPDDKSALQTTFAGIDPETVIQHDLPAEQSAALGLPASGVEQAQATAPTFATPQDPYANAGGDGWNPAFTQAPEAPTPSAPPPVSFQQPGTGLPAQLVDNAVEPHVSDYIGNGPDSIATMHPETSAEYYAGDPLANPNEQESAAAIEQMALHDPVGFAKLQAAHTFANERTAALAIAQAAKEDREQLEADQKMRADAMAATDKKMAALSAQAAEIYSRKIDPGSYMRNRSSTQALLDVIGAVAGAYAGGGGANQYVQMMQHRIDADIDAQKANIENAGRGVGVAKGLLAEEYARTGDLYQSAEAVRIAAKTAARDKIVADQQLYDPKGTRALMLGQAAAQMTAQIAAGQQAHGQKEFENHLKLGDLQLKALAEKRQREKDAADLAMKQAKLGAVGGAAKVAQVMTPAMWAAKNRIPSGVWGENEKNAYAQYVASVSPAQPSAAATTSDTAPGKFSSEDDWFSKNAPTAGDGDRKHYWFVDGKNGSEVPPIKLAAAVDAEKFIDKQRLRREMNIKADQLLQMTEKLQKRGAWSTAKAGFSWTEDADAKQARSLWQDLIGLTIQAKGMGVPSGNDVDRVMQMMGKDPAGWTDPTSTIQRAKESLQIEQDSDWSTAAPNAAQDPQYNKYRVLPNASEDWKAKFINRGATKEVAPEMGNTDPKQLTPKLTAADAPNVEKAKDIAETTANIKTATAYLTASRAVADDRTVPTPQQSDFKFAGPPEAADEWAALRTHYVNNVALLNKYEASHDPKEWKAFKTGQKEAESALRGVLVHSGRLYDPDYIPKAKRNSWAKDPAFVARLTRRVLDDGGSLAPNAASDPYGESDGPVTVPDALKLKGGD